jgi:pimeloyl-ACP methyl ester carboxylesterase
MLRRLPKNHAVPKPFLDSRVRLSDGRNLAYAQYGAPGGHAVFWFHGTPGARRQLPPDAPMVARERGFRIIAVERPGIGDSTHHPERTLLSWADDISELCDQIGIGRYAAVGLSGGGPYVLACAHQHPERMVCGISLGGVGPTDNSDGAPGYNDRFIRFARAMMGLRGPLGLALSAAIQPLRPFFSPSFELYVRLGPQSDREVMERPEMKAMFAADIIRATRAGLRGPVWDLHLFTRPWEFSPRDIDVPIRIWHGDIDQIVPLSHSVHLAEIIPDCELFVIPRMGHFAGFTSAPQVFDAIATLW